MINFINDNYDRHIITLEDPIEYYHKHNKSLVNQREIGVDVPDFKEGIRRALRMAPDIILVGEMRDLDTIHAAIEAAETGHVVFGTLHTNSAVQHRQPHHRRFPQGPAGPDPHPAVDRPDRRAVANPVAEEAGRRGGGLRNDGRYRRHPNLIRENKTYRIDSASRPACKEGMFLLDDTLFKLWKKGLCRKGRSAAEVPRSPRELANRIRSAEEGTCDDDEDETEDDDEDDDDDDARRRKKRVAHRDEDDDDDA